MPFSNIRWMRLDSCWRWIGSHMSRSCREGARDRHAAHNALNSVPKRIEGRFPGRRCQPEQVQTRGQVDSAKDFPQTAPNTVSLHSRTHGPTNGEAHMGEFQR
jgi:hypothetical protein